MALCVVVDTREQRPFTFACIVPPPKVVVATLQTGDYSLLGHEDQICVERKHLVDLFGTFGRGRDRFVRELERMAQMKFAAVVIEASFDTIIFRPPARSRLKPKTVIRSMAAWAIRHNVHFYWMPNRAAAEKWTYILLERFWDDLQTGKIKI